MGQGASNEVAFEAYGVRLVLGVSHEELLPRVAELAPPGSTRVDPAEDDARFVLTADEGGYHVGGTDQLELTTPDLELALGLLGSEVRLHVALRAPGKVFVNAGVVVQHGRALVLPGPSLSGTTTLVKALVAAGADYYSDTYAVFDGDGLVHPYPCRLGTTPLTPVTSPVPVGLVALAPYQPYARWEPEVRTGGAGALALLAHAVRFREQPELTLHTVRRALAGAKILAGQRGEAVETALALLDTLVASAVALARPEKVG